MKLTHLVTITGLGGLSLACSGALPCGPLAADGNPCLVERQCLIPGQEADCGINGYACDDGAWRELYTTCNPPMPAPMDCATVDTLATCNSGGRCDIVDPDDCGIVGYDCIDGAWEADHVVCNPPPGE